MHRLYYKFEQIISAHICQPILYASIVGFYNTENIGYYKLCAEFVPKIDHPKKVKNVRWTSVFGPLPTR